VRARLDAIGHFFFEGRAWNGRRAGEILGKRGLSFGSIIAVRDGIFGRGVLLDIAALRGVPYLAPGEAILPADLEAAEDRAGVRVTEGDVLLVRAGNAAPGVRLDGHDPEAICAGVDAACIPWLHARRVAVWASDCVEFRPQPYRRVRLPLHMVGMAAMGLVQFDALDLERLSVEAARRGRSDFLFVCAPVRLPGATASPANPLAVF
jgi:kynurenine formamidase